MKYRSIALLLTVAALAVASLACGGSFTTANIQDAYMSSDVDGENRTTVYGQDAIFYAQVDLANAPDDTTLKAVWVAVDAADVDPNFQIDETEFTSDDGLIHFELSNDQLWPVGEYKVDIYLNDTLTKTLLFEVQ